ncbi:hypothetical protein WJX72_003381 [[Myrmecia] bisecta]|uniref:RRM domain-containing protein n=1 Tax=[Myrmecia] bisecta TaxID=41462 RepID=A0AAW1QPT9_9CHLO
MAGHRGLKRPVATDAPDTITVARRCFVNNLAYEVSWQDLKDHFSQVGTVQYADVFRDGDGPRSRSKGCGVVEFADSSSAAAAIQTLNETEFRGRNILVREDREDKELRADWGAAPAREAVKRGRVQADSGTAGAVVGRKVYVSNVSYQTDWQTLKDHFKAAGTVLHADILKDGGASRGCGIVEMSTPAEALQAISLLSNTEVDGRMISVRCWEDREEGRPGRPASAAREVHLGNRPDATSSTGRQVVVHGLPYAMRWQGFKDMMRESGSVVRVDIAIDSTGRSRGFGTALFETEDEAQAAIERWNGAEYEGRTLGAKLDQFA